MTGDVSRGETLFGPTCAGCHGPQGTKGLQNAGSDDGSVPALNPSDLTHLRISEVLAKFEPDDVAMLDMGYLGVQNDRDDLVFILPFRKPEGGG